MAKPTPPSNGPGPESGTGSGWAAGPDPGAAGQDGHERASGRDVSLGAASDPIPAVVRLSPTPFVWQHDRRLLLLDREPGSWVVAELRFDAARCRYVEVRRARFRWPREAVGALLAHAIAISDAAAERLADDLLNWVAGLDGTPDPGST